MKGPLGMFKSQKATSSRGKERGVHDDDHWRYMPGGIVWSREEKHISCGIWMRWKVRLAMFNSQRETLSIHEIDDYEAGSGCRAIISKGQLAHARIKMGDLTWKLVWWQFFWCLWWISYPMAIGGRQINHHLKLLSKPDLVLNSSYYIYTWRLASFKFENLWHWPSNHDKYMSVSKASNTPSYHFFLETMPSCAKSPAICWKSAPTDFTTAWSQKYSISNTG